MAIVGLQMGFMLFPNCKVKVGDKVKITGTVKEGYMEEVTLGAGKPLRNQRIV